MSRSSDARAPKRSPARRRGARSGPAAAPERLAGWRLTVRHGPKVVKESHDSLDEAIAAMKRHVDDVRRGGNLPPASFIRTYDSSQRVNARLEIAAPGGFLRRASAGLDIKGDGTLVAYRGEIFKKPLEPARGESELDAIRRALSG